MLDKTGIEGYSLHKIKEETNLSDTFDCDLFMFVTKRGETAGCIWLEKADQQLEVKLLVCKEKHLEKGVVEALLTFSAVKSKEMNLKDSVLLNRVQSNLSDAQISQFIEANYKS